MDSAPALNSAHTSGERTQFRLTGKITHGKWARGSGPGLCGDRPLVSDRIGLGSLGDGDAESECLDLPDVVGHLAVACRFCPIAGSATATTVESIPATADPKIIAATTSG